jgi:SAM-dependent methyltransferase
MFRDWRVMVTSPSQVRVTNSVACPFCGTGLMMRWRQASLWRCPDCGLLFRHPLPTQQELSELYCKSWLDPGCHEAETGSTELDLAFLLARKIATTLRRRDFRGLRILEFGAGRGGMQAALGRLGANVVAVEPFGYEYLKSRGVTVYRSLDELPDTAGFDGIITLEVVEHLTSPWIELRQLRELLTPGGWLFVSTVNANGLNARLSRFRWREINKPGHVVFFGPRSMESLLSHCGYSDVQRLRWLIGYDKTSLRKLALYATQLLAIDGELRYMAWNS